MFTPLPASANTGSTILLIPKLKTDINNFRNYYTSRLHFQFSLAQDMRFHNTATPPNTREARAGPQALTRAAPGSLVYRARSTDLEHPGPRFDFKNISFYFF